MGCLIEFIFEVVLEALFELVGYTYIWLMTLIVPDKTITEHQKEKIKRRITVVAAVLGLVLIIGAIFALSGVGLLGIVGKYMVYIPLTIICVQILLGIVVKIISAIKK